jgi:hypothetical protein
LKNKETDTQAEHTDLSRAYKQPGKELESRSSVPDLDPFYHAILPFLHEFLRGKISIEKERQKEHLVPVKLAAIVSRPGQCQSLLTHDLFPSTSIT